MPWKHLIVRTLLSWSALAICLGCEALVVHKVGFAAVAGMTRQERLDELFSDFAREAPGLAVGVARNGEVLFQKGYGLADLERKTPIAPDTAFHIASCGKEMTAVAVLMLVEEGKLDLDKSVAKYLPEMRGWGRKVTLRELLHHTAGIPDTYEALKGRGGVPTGTDALRLLARWHRLDYSPGTQFLYSDSGYDILGTLIHRVSRQSYPAFLEERIFRPAGMKDTFVYDPERLKTAKRALGYDRGFGGWWILDDDSPLNLLYGSGGVYSTVADLARYDRALFGGQLLRPASLASMFQPAELQDGTTVPYGFGWSLKTDDHGEPYYGHSGNWLGFTAYYLHFPKDGLAVMILSNRSDTDTEYLATTAAEMFREGGSR
ncbi:MAG TPA: serine hydrolase domain-containing protein [Thermoanaerobaculia bacterium]